jgi:hypothetical protein
VYRIKKLKKALGPIMGRRANDDDNNNNNNNNNNVGLIKI